MSQDENKNSEQNSENNEENIEKNNTEVKSEEDTSKKINSEDEDEDKSEEEDDGEQDEIDYKSEYERLQGELALKNERIEKQDKKIIKLKRKDDDEYQDDDQEDLNQKDLDQVVAKKVQEQMSSFVEDTIDEELDKATSNSDEKKLIKWYFDNRIVKSGWAKKDIIQYIGEAKALANSKKLITTSKMLAKKVKSDETKGTPNFAGTPAKQSPKITEKDKEMAQRFFKGDVNKWLKYKS